MNLTLIAAVAKNNVIGDNGDMPWHIPEDLKRFKEKTLHHPVIMGRVTYESILNRLDEPLPNRQNFVVTRKDSLREYENTVFCRTIDDAITGAKVYSGVRGNIDEIYVIGGSKVYHDTIRLADKLDITRIDKEIEGDRYFPEIDESIWEESDIEKHNGYSFVQYKRR